MMEFSEIEYISYSLWFSQKLSQKPPHSFKQRTDKVINSLDEKRDKSTIDLLFQAINLAKRRNTIAHNPTLLQIFENKDTNQLHREFAINTFLEGDYIDLPELKELVAEARDIKTQLYMKFGYLPLNNRKNG